MRRRLIVLLTLLTLLIQPVSVYAVDLITGVKDNAPQKVTVNAEKRTLANGSVIYVDTANNKAWIANGTGDWKEVKDDGEVVIHGPKSADIRRVKLDLNPDKISNNPNLPLEPSHDDPYETVRYLNTPAYYDSEHKIWVDISKHSGWVPGGKYTRGYTATGISPVQSPSVVVYMPNVYGNATVNTWGSAIPEDYPYVVGNNPARWYVITAVTNPNSFDVDAKVNITKPLWDGTMTANDLLLAGLQSLPVFYNFGQAFTTTVSLGPNETKYLLVDKGIHGNGIATVQPGGEARSMGNTVRTNGCSAISVSASIDFSADNKIAHYNQQTRNDMLSLEYQNSWLNGIYYRWGNSYLSPCAPNPDADVTNFNRNPFSGGANQIGLYFTTLYTGAVTNRQSPYFGLGAIWYDFIKDRWISENWSGKKIPESLNDIDTTCTARIYELGKDPAVIPTPTEQQPSMIEKCTKCQGKGRICQTAPNMPKVWINDDDGGEYVEGKGFGYYREAVIEVVCPNCHGSGSLTVGTPCIINSESQGWKVNSGGVVDTTITGSTALLAPCVFVKEPTSNSSVSAGTFTTFSNTKVVSTPISDAYFTRFDVPDESTMDSDGVIRGWTTQMNLN